VRQQEGGHEDRPDAGANSKWIVGPQVVNFNGLHALGGIGKQFAGCLPKFDERCPVQFVRGLQAPDVRITIFAMESSSLQEGLIEPALGREAFESKVLQVLVLQHRMNQVAPGFDARARRRVPIDQFAPKSRRVLVKVVGQIGGATGDRCSGRAGSSSQGPSRSRHGGPKLLFEFRAGGGNPGGNFAFSDLIALQFRAALHGLQANQLQAQFFDPRVVWRDPDGHGPRAAASNLSALFQGGLQADFLGGERQQEKAKLPLLGSELGGESLRVFKPAQGDIHPTKRSRLVVVPLGDRRVEVGDAGQNREIDAGKG